MIKARNIITPELKAKILGEFEVSGCSILHLVKSYNVSKSSIYKWRNKAKLLQLNNTAPEEAPKFVEVSVASMPPAPSSLVSATLKFNNFSVIIEGELQSKLLLSILQLLEEQSC